VLDIEAFNAEVDRKKEDATKLEALGSAVGQALKAALDAMPTAGSRHNERQCRPVHCR
jgi:hypothetical protein